jgi:EAL domain-containing protein (putative c-di-GMP-specific phosphodiesterase class I)/CHASE2 domain-containing sensor protein
MRSSRMWVLLLAAAVGLTAGLVTLFGPLDGVMKVASNRLRQHPASGQIVLVAVDDRSLAELGAQPWPRSYYADLIERLHAAGAHRIVVDADTSRAESGPRDQAFRKALSLARPTVWLTAHSSVDEISGKRFDSLPPKAIGDEANIANANSWVERGTIWSQLYAVPSRGRVLPSIASVLGGRTGAAGSTFPLNYSIDVRTVPVISAADVIRGKWQSKSVDGRDVVIGDTSSGALRFAAPGYAALPAILFQIIGAETLREGVPATIGWPVPLCAALLAAVAFLFVGHRPAARATLSLAALCLVAGPLLFEHVYVFGGYTPALTVLSIVAASHAIAKFRTALRTRGTVNPISGMKNFNALRQEAPPKPAAVLVVRVLNYPAISATLTPLAQRELVDQIKRRLLFGAPTSEIFQGDEGIFTWTAECKDQDLIAEQLEALHALFRSPVVVAARLIDLAVSFGLDVDVSRPVLQRASSALVAADEAARQGRRWLTYDSSVLEDADWQMSVLARLDQAIDAGEIWVAYQSKLDLSSDQLVGAEALARWTHPERGEISPGQFIPAAERGDRIERLTDYILGHAIQAAASINRSGRRFEIAVNLSARLLANDRIVHTVAALLKQHALAPDRLILEVTETAAIDDQDRSLRTLQQLSLIGIGLSIDDYGTGFSTLEYLRKIPAKEIKIDRSFVSLLDKSQSDRIMVNSTVQLAHSLGRTVVAEGVETVEVLNELRRMGCDLAQGYHIARPVPLEVLLAQPILLPKWRAA